MTDTISLQSDLIANYGTYCIRHIQEKDNIAIKTIIINTLEEFGCTGEGFSCADPELDFLDTIYKTALTQPGFPELGYWVVETSEGEILGGGGFSPLKGMPKMAGICELQKFYFSPKLRGAGVGRYLVEQCVELARQANYKTIYLETLQQMQQAIRLYEKLGFQRLDNRLGETGHWKMNVFMTRNL